MGKYIWVGVALAAVVLFCWLLVAPTPACSPVWRGQGKEVVNADQTVIIIWDAATKTEHFIRKASFRSAADDFGFLVPTPTQPELEESGNDAFPYLQKLTEPEKIKVYDTYLHFHIGCGKSESSRSRTEAVHVRVQKEVAGFHAVVLKARSASALVGWLKDNGFVFSPEVEAWAKPYVEKGWMITAMRVGAGLGGRGEKPGVRLGSAFDIQDRPSSLSLPGAGLQKRKTLTRDHRLLRIYFIGEARYKGDLDKLAPWSGKLAWADKLNGEQRQKCLELLNLPQSTGPSEWWLTEFEDDWAYKSARPIFTSFETRSKHRCTERPFTRSATRLGQRTSGSLSSLWLHLDPSFTAFCGDG